MGITDLLKELPGGNATTSTRFGFANLTILRSFPASIDTGTLLFVCALRHKEAYDEGSYPPTVSPTTMPMRRNLKKTTGGAERRRRARVRDERRGASTFRTRTSRGDVPG